MKIFSTAQIRAWDEYTIRHEPIASVDLMNRAAAAFVAWFMARYPDTEREVWIVAGTGNNGGDGLAVARLLHQQFYPVKVLVCDFSGKHSPDFDAQLAAFPDHLTVALHFLHSAEDFPDKLPDQAVLIDALFGSGLTRPLTGQWADLITKINRLPQTKVAIDLPSGLFADRHTDGPCVEAEATFSFETPKLAFFFPENANRVGECAFGSIGLGADYAAATETPFHYLDARHARTLYKPRTRFSHKGSYGHALLINGSLGKMGAAVLAASACLRSGVGLLTLHTPGCGYAILQTAVPEAMCSLDRSEAHWSKLPDLERYSAIGVGCGIGQAPATAQALKQLIRKAQIPLVVDADALNILAQHPGWMGDLPAGSVLTPHPKEFERLFGATANHFERNERQRAMAAKYGIYILLKGAFSAVAGPDGSCWFNATGNPGMATGGSGDALTGILAGLLAQGYSPEEACHLGVYLHGLAGDLAAAAASQPGMTVGDLIRFMGKAWQMLGAP